jgi:glycerophosphoryl diester phosphodiesterase
MIRITFLLSLLCHTIFLCAQTSKILDVEAHAGGKGLYPGNSIPAFIHSLTLGVTTLEMDCVISKDSQVVVSHDPFMSHIFMRTSAGKDINKEEERTYNLFQMPYDSIRQYQLGVKVDQEFPTQKLVKTYKPLLSEVIDSVEAYIKKHRLKPVHYNIEVKSYHQASGMSPEPRVFVDLVMAVIQKYRIQERVIIQSFDVRPLQYLRQSYPGVKISYLLSKSNILPLQENLHKLGFTPPILSPEYPMLTPEMMAEARRLGMAVIPWTVDEEADLRRLIDLQVNGIITNYPDRLLKLLSGGHSSVKAK